MYTAISKSIEQWSGQSIAPERKQVLDDMTAYFKNLMSERREAINICIICTHNSRRSQLAQVWATAIASYFGLENFKFYSGGTEVTAMHPNVAAVLKTKGFEIQKKNDSANPHYRISFGDEEPPFHCYSKRYSEIASEIEPFTALMTCAHADQNCPYIPEAQKRFSWTFEDPGKADNTSSALKAYNECSKMIASELHYIFKELAKAK